MHHNKLSHLKVEYLKKKNYVPATLLRANIM
jgi:hypothetical protein